MNSESKGGKSSRKDIKNWLEWSVFGVSLLLVAGVLVFLTYKTYTHQSSPPDIRVSYAPSPTKNAPYRYHVKVQNIGGQTAEEVIIEVMLLKEGEVLERSQVQLPFLPNSATHESWVNFTLDPARSDSTAYRVMSYKKP